MNHVDELKRNSAQLIAQGDHAAAIRMYESALTSGLAASERFQIMTDLVNACVRVSHHSQALRHAATLETELGLPPFRRLRTRMASILVAMGYLSGPGVLKKSLIWMARALVGASRMRTAPWQAVRAIQFAHFWNDIERCVHYAVLQLSLVSNKDEESASMAWLGYAMAYRGISWLSVSVLAQVIDEARARGADALTADLYPLLGLSFLMTGRSAEVKATFDAYDKEFPNAPEFYKLLTLTARINLHIAGGELVDAEKAIGRCFSYAFAMDKSRHHIQIYGASAALAAAEGRPDRALRDLKVSEQAALANDNHLDFLIHYRYAALVHLNLHDSPAAERCLERLAVHLKAYGSPLWYHCQYEELRGLVRRSSWTFRSAFTVWVRCLGHSLTSFNLDAALDLVRKSRLHLFVERRHYWSSGSVTAYLKHKLTSLPEETKNREASNFSEKVSQAILDLGRGEDRVEDLVSQIFPDSTVLHAPNLRGLVDAARVLVDTDGFTIFDDQSQTIRVPCSDGRFLLGLVVPKLHDAAVDQAVGILTSGLDVHSVSFAEAALKLVVSDFASLAAAKTLAERQAKDREIIAVGRAAQALAHDIRRPFSLISAGLSVLSRAQTPEDIQTSASQLRADVEASLEKVNAMIRDVIQAGSPLHLEKTGGDLKDLLEANLDAVVRSLAGAQACVSMKLRHSANVRVDRVKLGRAFDNVLINAFQATAGMGRIWIRSRDLDTAKGAAIELVVGNDGPSIAVDALSRLFDPFFTSGKKGGTGLGLAITRNVVRAHGGEVVCRSSGEGVEFVFTLPAEAAGRVDETPARVPGWVALADDSPFVLDAWKHALPGVSVRTFTRGTDLLHEVRRKPALLDDLTCVITDYHFGDHEMTGLELLSELRSLDSAIPVVLASDGEFSHEVRRRFDRVVAKMAVNRQTVAT